VSLSRKATHTRTQTMQTVTENEQVGPTVNNDCSLTNVMIG